MRDLGRLVVLFIILFSELLLASSDNWVSHNDGTVRDTATGLVWQQSSDDVILAQTVAMSYCANLRLGGADNWRLPNVKELLSIVDFRTEGPMVDKRDFPNMENNSYWSATSKLNNESENTAHFVSFEFGEIETAPKTIGFNVRCVR